MAYRVRLMLRAADDAEKIYRRIVQEAPLQGQEWYNRLIQALDSLDTFPQRCIAVENLSQPGSAVRMFLYGRKPHSFRIYFEIVEETVCILHIRHGARREPTRRELFH